MKKRTLFTLSGACSASASTTLVGNSILGLDDFDWFQVSATLIGPTGGTVDVYLQRKIDTGVWQDWVHFPQMSAGTTKRYVLSAQSTDDITEVGGGNDATPGVALSANTNLGGHPCMGVRMVTVTGSGVSVAATQTIYINAFRDA